MKTVIANQSIIDATSLKPIATELLLRSHQGVELAEFLTYPSLFIEHLSDLTDSKVLFVFELMKTYPSHVYFVNYTPGQIAHEDFIKILGRYSKAGIPASSIGLEITEATPIACWATLKENLKIARALGFHIIIDDFTQGNSNLKALLEINPNVVKLDMSIIQGAEHCNRHRALLNASVRLIHEMGAKVVIEGIETAQQLNLARISGADMLQGFFISKPDVYLPPTGEQLQKPACSHRPILVSVH
ncbi:EAL domain-containing protein [Rheinheimera hassiensis]|uniref:EAL domain-containing protein n=1 Tax=Rheinheimera hassiensis TaxID=1193627 RepID=UPI001F064877|nr:EAL domain-containing protein [Rheinheimera hassiensis]